jgi:hypothetical protein
MFDIFYINPKQEDFTKLKERFPLAKQVNNFAEAKQKAFTKMFWVVWNDLVLDVDFKFDYAVPEWDQQYIHIFNNGKHFDGVCLFPKTAMPAERELKHRFFLKKKEINIQASSPKLYDIFHIDTYEEYKTALETSTTEMFWMTSHNLRVFKDFKFDMYFSHHNTDDRNHNHAFIHQTPVSNFYNGIFLCTKNKPLTQREIEYRFPIQRREWDIVASIPLNYENYSGIVSTYADYLDIAERSPTELFWIIPSDVKLNPEFDFSTYFLHDNEFDRKINHVFLNSESYDGVMLLSKHNIISEREFKHRFLVNKKEWEIVASTPVKYDMFYIDSYEEYLTAMEQTTTEMFWMTSRNLSVDPNFKFDMYITHHNTVDRNQTHAFIHRVGDKDSYNGIFLCSKNVPWNKKEVEYRFPVERKEYDIVASGPVIYQQYVFNQHV